VARLFGLQKTTFVLTTTVQLATNMGILDNLEYSMADDDGMPSKSVTEAIKEMLEDPEHQAVMERLKYMEEHGI
jgi:hypothetical protein